MDMDEAAPAEIGEPDAEEKLQILHRLLASQDGGGAATASGPAARQVGYEAGLCVKARDTAGGRKCFINLCQSPDMPAPPDATDEQLARLMEDPDSHAGRFRIPLSIGEAHAERDRAGAACVAYDVVAHPRLLERMQESDVYRSFGLGLALESVESKHGLTLSRESVAVLRNKRYIGSLQQQAAQHYVRAGGAPRPFIQEVSSSGASPAVAKSGERPDSKAQPPRPEFRLVQEPAHGAPSYFVCEARLPLVASADGLQLQVGGDRMLITCRSRAYRLDFYLPVDIDQVECRAQFDTDTRVLTVTMPVERATLVT